MVSLQKKYEEYFRRANELLRKYRIAELSDYEAPEFDFREIPNIILYAQARINIINLRVLNDLKKFINVVLEKACEGARISITSKDGLDSLLIIPNTHSPRNTWQEQTDRVASSLAARIEDFRMKNKS